jgi:hypothetical protein
MLRLQYVVEDQIDRGTDCTGQVFLLCKCEIRKLEHEVAVDCIRIVLILRLAIVSRTAPSFRNSPV